MCVANENRSQIAEAVFNKLSKNNAAMSAGLKPNLAGALLRSVRSNFVEIMEEEGYDVSKAKVKRVNRRMADSAGKIVFVFNKKHLKDAPAYLRNRPETELWEVGSISDGASVDEYARLERRRIRQIEARVEELLGALEATEKRLPSQSGRRN